MGSSLHNYLEMHRLRAGLSRTFVARLLGYWAASSVGRHEVRKRLPTLEAAFAYAAVYGCSVDELFAGLKEAAEKNVRDRAEAMLAETTDEELHAFLVGILEGPEVQLVPWPED